MAPPGYAARATTSGPIIPGSRGRATRRDQQNDEDDSEHVRCRSVGAPPGRGSRVGREESAGKTSPPPGAGDNKRQRSRSRSRRIVTSLRGIVGAGNRSSRRASTGSSGNGRSSAWVGLGGGGSETGQSDDDDHDWIDGTSTELYDNEGIRPCRQEASVSVGPGDGIGYGDDSQAHRRASSATASLSSPDAPRSSLPAASAAMATYVARGRGLGNYAQPTAAHVTRAAATGMPPVAPPTGSPPPLPPASSLGGRSGSPPLGRGVRHTGVLSTGLMGAVPPHVPRERATAPPRNSE